MRLTGRQRQFVETFLALHKQTGRPLHYAAVAEQLGISPMTAYDMLRLLEGQGLVSSEYVLPEGGGRGRSNIVFSPTQKLLAAAAQGGDDTGQEEWETLKGRILRALREGRGTNYQSLLEDVLQRIPECQSPMLYVAEMMTAVLIQLHQLQEDAKSSLLTEGLQSVAVLKDVWLNALDGLALGLSLVERANRSVTSRLLSYSRTYQEHLARLTAENRVQLSDFAQEAMRIIRI